MAQALPRWLLNAGAVGVAGTGLAIAASFVQPFPPEIAAAPAQLATVGSGARSQSTAAAEEDDAGHACDCTALWACTQAGNGGCDLLENQLRACLARQVRPTALPARPERDRKHAKARAALGPAAHRAGSSIGRHTYLSSAASLAAEAQMQA